MVCEFGYEVGILSVIDGHNSAMSQLHHPAIDIGVADGDKQRSDVQKALADVCLLFSSEDEGLRAFDAANHHDVRQALALQDIPPYPGNAGGYDVYDRSLSCAAQEGRDPIESGASLVTSSARLAKCCSSMSRWT